VTELQERAVNAHLHRRENRCPLRWLNEIHSPPGCGLRPPARGRGRPRSASWSLRAERWGRTATTEPRPARETWEPSVAEGEFLLFLGDDVEVPAGDWIDELLPLRPGSPGVGARLSPALVDPEGSVQSAGIAVGLQRSGRPGDGPDSPRTATGYYGSLSAARGRSPRRAWNCLLVRRSVFTRPGGDSTRAYTRQFQDFDLCMELRRRGLSVVCTPLAPGWSAIGPNPGGGQTSTCSTGPLFRRPLV